MKEIDFLPSSTRRPVGHRRRRLGPILAVALIIAVAGGLHWLRSPKIGAAHAGTTGVESRNTPRHVQWTLPADRTTGDPAIDTILAGAFASESGATLVKTLDVRYGTTVISIDLHNDAAIGQPAGASLASLLGAGDSKPLAAELTGLVSTDLDLGVLIGRISAGRRVGNVRVLNTRATLCNDRRMSEFRISIEIRNNRNDE